MSHTPEHVPTAHILGHVGKAAWFGTLSFGAFEYGLSHIDPLHFAMVLVSITGGGYGGIHGAAAVLETTNNLSHNRQTTLR